MMKSLLECVRPLMTALMAVIMANCGAGTGCAAFNPGKVPDRAYETQQAACVASSPTLKASCECRKGVDVQWGVCDRPEAYHGNSCLKDCEKL